jgi:molybdate transport system ATP-binding protein
VAISVQIEKKLGSFPLQVNIESKSRRIGILGASGCGKSMTLKSIAGIVTPDRGRILVEGRTLYDSEKRIFLKPQKRQVGYLFQNYALFPTMTVRKNIAAGVRGSRKKKEETVNSMLEKFQLEELGERFPGELSGGQQQRVALARIMAYEPSVILLDEPFSALDVFLKDRLQQKMQEMLSDYSGTVILVSHSRDEIYRFSEELFIMDGGQNICQGKTKEVFENPGWKEAARLTGCKNITAVEKKGERELFVPDWELTLTLTHRLSEEIRFIGIRAHDFVPVWGEREENCIPCRIKSIAEQPFETQYFIQGADTTEEEICWFLQRDRWKEMEEKGSPNWLKLPEEKVLLLK